MFISSSKPSDLRLFPKSALSKGHGPKIGQYITETAFQEAICYGEVGAAYGSG
jgi:hypothetical protein